MSDASRFLRSSSSFEWWDDHDWSGRSNGHVSNRFQEVLDGSLDVLRERLLEEHEFQLKGLRKRGTLRRTFSPDAGQRSEKVSFVGYSSVHNSTGKMLMNLDDPLQPSDGADSVHLNRLPPSIAKRFTSKPTFSRSLKSTKDWASRWKDLTLKLARPTYRHSMLQTSMQVVIHECWGQYLTKLRNGDEFCWHELSKAMVTIWDARAAQPKEREVNLIRSTLSVPFQRRSYFGIIHPDSALRRFWLLLSIAFLCHDAFFLPLQAFFELEHVFGIELMRWAARVFWSVDILMSLRTGVYVNGLLVEKVSGIFQHYLQTWLLLDVALVLSDWLLLAVIIEQARVLRFFRLILLLRLGKIKSTARKTWSMNWLRYSLYNSMLKLVLALLFFVHFVACLWYAIGNADNRGWAQRDSENDMSYGTQTLWFTYWTCAHWALAQIHGTNQLIHGTSFERFFATIVVFIGFLLFTMFFASAVHVLSRLDTSHRREIMMQCATYAQARGLPIDVTRRAHEYLAAWFSKANVAQQLIQENKLLAHFPQSLAYDILEETRKPILVNMTFMKELGLASSRTLRRICAIAVNPVPSSKFDVIFTSMEACSKMRFVESGRLVYFMDKSGRLVNDDAMIRQLQQPKSESPFTSNSTSTPTPNYGSNSIRTSRFGLVSKSPRNSQAPNVAQKSTTSHASTFQQYGTYVNDVYGIHPGEYLSEAALWTRWRHSGSLISINESRLLELELDSFYCALETRIEACLLAARCAQRFARYVTHNLNRLHDLVEFDIEKCGNIGDNDEDDITDSHHLIFLSHYKAEAGTEATLLTSALDPLLPESSYAYEGSPVFLDSEDLDDLGMLEEHVSNSQNLLLLLTPGVLQRPWCLIEVVVAFRHAVHIVPVEIQRPGMKFEYPNETFYQCLLKGELLTEGDWAMLAKADIDPSELEAALRYLFQQIVLPFSPHRSKTVRGAELNDILKRCQFTAIHLSRSLLSMTSSKSKAMAQSESVAIAGQSDRLHTYRCSL